MTKITPAIDDYHYFFVAGMIHYPRQAESRIPLTKTNVMGWVIGLFIVMALIAAFLLLPVEVEANSERAVYRAGISRIMDIRLMPEGAGWKWRLCIGWWKREYNFGLLAERKPQKAAKPRGRKKWSLRPAIAWKKARRLLASFRIRRFIINLDTDDFILNAYLYPIFTLLNGRNRRLAINFEGQTVVDVFLTNRVWKVIWSLIR